MSCDWARQFARVMLVCGKLFLEMQFTSLCAEAGTTNPEFHNSSGRSSRYRQNGWMRAAPLRKP